MLVALVPPMVIEEAPPVSKVTVLAPVEEIASEVPEVTARAAELVRMGVVTLVAKVGLLTTFKVTLPPRATLPPLERLVPAVTVSEELASLVLATLAPWRLAPLRLVRSEPSPEKKPAMAVPEILELPV